LHPGIWCLYGAHLKQDFTSLQGRDRCLGNAARYAARNQLLQTQFGRNEAAQKAIGIGGGAGRAFSNTPLDVARRCPQSDQVDQHQHEPFSPLQAPAKNAAAPKQHRRAAAAACDWPPGMLSRATEVWEFGVAASLPKTKPGLSDDSTEQHVRCRPLRAIERSGRALNVPPLQGGTS
jgi:hypothetical protein